MQKCLCLVTMLLMVVSVSQVSFSSNSQPAIQKMNQMPLAFTKNMGQWDERVLFRADAGGATMWFTKEGVTYQFIRNIRRGTLHVPAGTRSVPLQEGLDPRRSLLRTLIRGGDDAGASAGAPPLAVGSDSPLERGLRGVSDRDSIETLVLTAKFIGANPNPEVIGENMMEYKCNYFLGNDPTKWHTDVPNYEAITLKNIYPGIDLEYYSNGDGKMEYDFIIQPGADPAQIAVRYDGADEVCVDDTGSLVVETQWGNVSERAPIAYQVVNGTRQVVESDYYIRGENVVGFRPNKDYDPEFAIVIDPVLSYSTYLGGGSFDWGDGIAIDSNGNAYVTGKTLSSNFPTLNPYQTCHGDGDAFVTKLSSSGNSLIYSTYLGGSSHDYGESIAVDGGGSAYVTGSTDSHNFPTQGPFQRTYGGGKGDAFVTKLSSSGNRLTYSTYLGGGDDDGGYGIAVDGSGKAYVTGATKSSSFPTQNPYQTYHGDGDVFVTKFSSTGNSLIYSTFLGGGSLERGCGIAVDSSGNAYVTGYTFSSDFPTLNPYQATLQGGDAFVTKLSSSGNSLIYSTYLGGQDQDEGHSIAIDGSSSAYVTGWTLSSDFPTLKPYQSFQGVADAFVTKLSSTGTGLIYSTYLGGGGRDEGFGIAVDGSGNAYVTGSAGTNFPTLNPYQTGEGVFVTEFSSLGTMIYGTCLNGGLGNGIAVDGSGNAYVTGWTNSSNFPTQNPYQTNQGYNDAFVTKLRLSRELRDDADAYASEHLTDPVYLINYVFSGGSSPQAVEDSLQIEARLLQKRAEAEVRQKEQVAERAEAERRAEEEFDADGLVLLRKSVTAWGGEYGGGIAGIVVNRRNRTLSYAVISFNLYDESGAQIGSAIANINNLEPGGRWKFKATTFGKDFARYKFANLSGF